LPCELNNVSDLKFAVRQLRKSPGFTLVAVLTLALGIGANTAIFSIVNAVLLRPLPYPNADRMMVLNESSGPGQDYSVALPDYFDWRNDNTVFKHLAATHKESRNLSGISGRDPERVSCASVTRNFFDIIGLPPEIGRTFSEDEDKVGAAPVVIISDRPRPRGASRASSMFARFKHAMSNTAPAMPISDVAINVIGPSSSGGPRDGLRPTVVQEWPPFCPTQHTSR
jgi:hypothetical protein